MTRWSLCVCNVLHLMRWGENLLSFIINLKTKQLKKTTPKGRLKQTEFLQTHYETKDKD